MIPSGYDVADMLGQGDDTALVDLAERHLPLVTAQVRAYTRGRGFIANDPADDLALVIIAATTRSVVNPQGLRAENLGTFSVQYQVTQGWTLPELAILHGYRRRAA